VYDKIKPLVFFHHVPEDCEFNLKIEVFNGPVNYVRDQKLEAKSYALEPDQFISDWYWYTQTGKKHTRDFKLMIDVGELP
jgi:hypothetical protein